MQVKTTGYAIDEIVVKQLVYTLQFNAVCTRTFSDLRGKQYGEYNKLTNNIK